MLTPDKLKQATSIFIDVFHNMYEFFYIYMFSNFDKNKEFKTNQGLNFDFSLIVSL